MPSPLLRGGHAFYWATEVFAPLGFLLAGPRAAAARGRETFARAAARATVLLMCGIVAGGNFGWFNLLTAVLCAPLCVDGAGGEADGAAAGEARRPTARRSAARPRR